MIWKWKLYAKSLDQVFRRGSRLDAHLARVAVLYEDLRLEREAALAESIPAIDELGAAFRKLYFIRRSVATTNEVAEAIRLINALPDFKAVLDGFPAADQTRWMKSIRSLARLEYRLKKLRNDYGGHFGLAPAIFAVENVTERAVVLELHQLQPKELDIRFKFASEIAALGMMRQRNTESQSDGTRWMFRVIGLGYGHASRCAHLLGVNVIWDRFGTP